MHDDCSCVMREGIRHICWLFDLLTMFPPNRNSRNILESRFSLIVINARLSKCEPTGLFGDVYAYSDASECEDVELVGLLRNSLNKTT